MHPARQADPPGPVTIRPLARDDFPLLHRWLAMPHVQAWWPGEPATPAGIERKYAPRVDGTEPTRVFIIELTGQAIGIILCYRHEDHTDWDRAAVIERIFGD